MLFRRCRRRRRRRPKDGKGFVRVYPNVELRPGQEVVNNYGARTTTLSWVGSPCVCPLKLCLFRVLDRAGDFDSNAELLWSYGFCLRHNPWDTVPLVLAAPAAADPPLESWKEAMLRQVRAVGGGRAPTRPDCADTSWPGPMLMAALDCARTHVTGVHG